MKSIDPETQSEIIIVRRSRDNDEEEHGSGVWKIAYADLMTAMMTFFLVMWLINVIDSDKKTAVASYFNPIKLVEFESSPRGLHDIRDKARSGQGAQGEAVQETGGNSAIAKAQGPEEESHMMALPYQVLDSIARTRPGDTEYHDGKGGAADGGMQQGSAKGIIHRDPFSPEYWSKDMPLDMARSLDQLAVQDAHSKNAEEKNQQSKKTIFSAQASAMQKARAEGTKDSTDKAAGKKEKSAELARNISSGIAALIRKEIKTDYPQVHVNLVDNGIAIELTDSQNYGMFAVGSAKPDKQLVVLLDGIAKIIRKHAGQVIISGHTDARPYKTTHYDNWQLSAARAQMAYYMLVRGGLDEGRVLRVEGYADRSLKNSKDSYAAENRRISIFLQLPKTETP